MNSNLTKAINLLATKIDLGEEVLNVEKELERLNKKIDTICKSIEIDYQSERKTSEITKNKLLSIEAEKRGLQSCHQAYMAAILNISDKLDENIEYMKTDNPVDYSIGLKALIKENKRVNDILDIS